jgi:cytochrome c peroxidase
MKPLTNLSSALTLALVAAGGAQALSPEEQLGQSIFFDTNLSINGNQACAVCHTPEAGWTGPDSLINAGGAVYEGSILGRFGNRKPPSSAYATPSPILHFVVEKSNPQKEEVLFLGGNFWDGRATGEDLGNPAADQARGPFLNPVEQAAPDKACIVYKVCTAGYPVTFEDVWGAGACAIAWPMDVDMVCAAEDEMVDLSEDDRIQVDQNYDQIALSVAAFEASPESNAYSSKFDAYLAGLVDLTKEEKKGLNLFKGKGKCANCHILDPGPNGEPPLLTDFTFDNLGVPRNPENPWYEQLAFNPLGEDWIDLGLGGFLQTRVDYQQYAPENLGKQKVPTLRNVDKRPYPEFVKAYAHNGFFKSLKGIVHFYSTRDLKPSCESLGILDATEAVALANDCWPEPEVAANVNTKELGSLRLTEAQEDAIVAFLKTLSDGYFDPAP